MSIAIIPILLLLLLPVLMGAIPLIVLGIWGQPRWSSPYCAQCRYDLRGRNPDETTKCPECGCDLTRRKAVAYVRYGRRWGLLAWGVLTLLSPLLVAAVLMLVQVVASRSNPSRTNLAQQSNTLVVQAAGIRPDEPWAWRELGNRIKGGTLSAAEAQRAMDHLIAHMTATAPNGWDRPLPWQDDFAGPACQAGLIPDAQLYRFVDAYHGTAPRVKQLPRLLPHQSVLSFSVGYGNSWPLDQRGGLNVRVLSHLKQVRIDGKAMTPIVVYRHRHDVSARLENLDLAPGPHEIEFEFDLALAEARTLVGFDESKSGPEDWPPARRRWTARTRALLTVLAEHDQPVDLATDPQLDPAGGVQVKNLVARPEAGKTKLALDFELSNLNVALSFDVVLRVGDREHAFNPLTYRSAAGSVSHSGLNQTLIVDSLDPNLTEAAVHLTPNPDHLKADAQVNEVWGQPIVLKYLPLERYDVAEEK